MASLPSPIDPPMLHRHILQQMKAFEVHWLHKLPLMSWLEKVEYHVLYDLKLWSKNKEASLHRVKSKQH